MRPCGGGVSKDDKARTDHRCGGSDRSAPDVAIQLPAYRALMGFNLLRWARYVDGFVYRALYPCGSAPDKCDAWKRVCSGDRRDDDRWHAMRLGGRSIRSTADGNIYILRLRTSNN